MIYFKLFILFSKKILKKAIIYLRNKKDIEVCSQKK